MGYFITRDYSVLIFFICLCAFRLDQGLESDLFLLQCCAALAPPDLFVMRILERYGLMSYLSLVFALPNEYVFLPACLLVPILLVRIKCIVVHNQIFSSG